MLQPEGGGGSGGPEAPRGPGAGRLRDPYQTPRSGPFDSHRDAPAAQVLVRVEEDQLVRSGPALPAMADGARPSTRVSRGGRRVASLDEDFDCLTDQPGVDLGRHDGLEVFEGAEPAAFLRLGHIVVQPPGRHGPRGGRGRGPGGGGAGWAAPRGSSASKSWVAWNCRSLSPGKPTMISVAMETFGSRRRMRSTR